MGSNLLNKSFFVAFAFLSGETEQDYIWAIESLHNVTIRLENIGIPKVIVTDWELALLNAIRTVYPEAKSMLCEWHININVLSHSRKEYSFADENDAEKEFMAQFSAVNASPT